MFLSSRLETPGNASMSLQLVFQNVGDVQLPIHLSRPSSAPTAGIIVCHHAVGIYQDSFQRRFCDKLAQCGFLVALPDFYHRTWPATDMADSKGAGLQQDAMDLKRLMSEVDDANLERDLAACLELFQGQGISKVGIMGFCLGGRTSWLGACCFPEIVQACVMYHGGNIQKARRAEPEGKSPWELRKAIKCSVMGHFGALDTNPSPQDAQTYKEALAEQGVLLEFYEYEGANHGFSCADSTRYQQTGSDLAWLRTVKFLCNVLGQACPEPIPEAARPEALPGSACTSGCEEMAKMSKQ
eukprot:TRINITY_DN43624_c0_g1_i1.p1 TRINITY_DN43624_c0_g1~~TRINITY_DN43624_c0_g1_i1.p1  ORF type:complete len:298 (-),score=42.44 TRINITY_DN43624_c0_g1_i1:55-948(-)